MPVRDVLIVGAGPSGLATAIAAKQRGLDYVVVEKGILVNSIFQFPQHMVFFTTPELLEIGGLPLVTPYDKPTRLEALRYYRRVVDTFDLQISFHEAVTAIERGDDGVFTVTTRTPRGATRVREARAVVLAIGYYDIPNRLGVPGEDLPHVNHYYTDAHPYYRQRVVVVGGKNSAAEACLEIFRAGGYPTLVHRQAELGSTIKYWVRPDIENRIKEGSVKARFESRVVEITPTAVVIDGPWRPRGACRGRRVPADRLPARHRADAASRCRLRPRHARARDEHRHVRDQRAEPVRGRRRRGRAPYRQHLHRERPLPRRQDHRRAGAATRRLTMQFGKPMLAEWSFEPGTIYLNHGTVGVTPRRIMAVQQSIRDEMERHPSRFILRALFATEFGRPLPEPPRLRAAADAVAAFLGARGADLVFVDNITTGVNSILRSFPLREGDEILVSDLVYGGVLRAALFAARERGATVRTVEMPYPFRADQMVEAYAGAVGPRTRLAIVEHITAQSALVFPLARDGRAVASPGRGRAGRRRARARPDPGGHPVARCGLVCRQPPQVGVDAAQQRHSVGRRPSGKTGFARPSSRGGSTRGSRPNSTCSARATRRPHLSAPAGHRPEARVGARGHRGVQPRAGVDRRPPAGGALAHEFRRP
jgi:thioredoxin reductase (NADPH)